MRTWEGVKPAQRRGIHYPSHAYAAWKTGLSTRHFAEWRFGT
jgi:hypothetical protein